MIWKVWAINIGAARRLLNVNTGILAICISCRINQLVIRISISIISITTSSELSLSVSYKLYIAKF